MANTDNDKSNPAKTAGQRDRDSLAKRVLIIGLDGATFSVLSPMMDQGRMPRLKEFITAGGSGTLRSTVPPITPAAWTTFLTGKLPGTHGILDFERYDVHTNALSWNTTYCLDHVRSIWHILSDKGFKVGSINVPMTYPASKVNGCMVTGFETPSTESDFTWPPDLKHDILKRFPDYSYKTRWRRKAMGGDDVFADNLAYINKSFFQGADLTKFCGEKFGWDVLMVVFKLVDNLQHKTWKYLDPRTRDRYPERAEMTALCFNELDEAVGQLLDYAKDHDAHVIIVSDHGHGSLEGKVQPNLILNRWGYLKLKGIAARASQRARHLINRQAKRKQGKFATRNFTLEDDLAVDFSRTKAAVMHAGMAGFLYINLKGRQETGIVEASDYEALRDELRERFLAQTCQTPDGRSINVFPEVYKPEELYSCSRAEQEWLPDLLLIPAEAMAVVRKIRGSTPVQWLSAERMEGTHRPEGILAAAGPGIAAGRTVDSDIVNVAPTVLAMMGINVPDDMEGQVIRDLFEPALAFETEAAVHAEVVRDSAAAAFSEEEEELLTKRLMDLGYLE